MYHFFCLCYLSSHCEWSRCNRLVDKKFEIGSTIICKGEYPSIRRYCALGRKRQAAACCRWSIISIVLRESNIDDDKLAWWHMRDGFGECGWPICSMILSNSGADAIFIIDESAPCYVQDSLVRVYFYGVIITVSVISLAMSLWAFEFQVCTD